MQQPGSITFGTPLSSTTTAAPTFGTGGFGGFGQPSANPGLKFGATPAATPSLFGTTTTQPATGLSFGAPTTTTSTLGTSFSFGAPASSAAPLTFGAQPVAATTASTGFNFGTTSTPSTGLGFGTFNKPATGGLGGTAPTLNFGAQAVPATTAGASLFTGGGVGGLFGAKPITTATPVSTTQTASIGLGGVDTFQNKSDSTGTAIKENDGKLAKENPLPQEFLQLIDGFKNHIKQQKVYFSDVARGSAKPLLKVREDIDNLKTVLTEISNGQITNRQIAEKLKFDVAKCLSHAEMAQRIHDTPAGFQVDNSAPLQYFIETVNKFENDLSAIRQQIEVTEKHIKSLETPKTLSSQEMALGLRRLHETFVALAGRLQSLNSQVEMQKEQYLNMRKYLFKDLTNNFDKPSTNQSTTVLSGIDDTFKKLLNQPTLYTPPKRAAGPTPFSSLGAGATQMNFMSHQSNVADITTTSQPPPPAYPGIAQTSFNWGSPASSSSLIKTTQPPSYNASIGLTTSASHSSDFQLQKPPTGTKRGKFCPN